MGNSLRAAWCLGVVLAACAPKAAEPVKAPPAKASAKAAVVVAPPAEPAPATLRTGVIAPAPAIDRDVTVTARTTSRDFETLKVDLGAPVGDNSFVPPVANVKNATLAFISRGLPQILWVRRPAARAAEPIEGSLFTPAILGAAGREVRLRQTGPLPKAGPPSLEGEMFTFLASALGSGRASSDPFSAFAVLRLVDLATPGKKPAPRPGSLARHPPPDISAHELAELMNLTTGRTAVQRALMADRRLRATMRTQKRTVPLTKVAPPNLPRADYKAMLTALGRTPPSEPLAQAAPADFWYFRSRTFAAFLDVLDLVDDWGQPAANVLDGRPSDRGTSARYLAELGIERTELARVLGPTAIDSVALVGSDPYVHAGTDVTVLFKVKVPALFETSLAKALATHAAAHGGVTTTTSDHQGVSIRSSRSPDGRVRQERAQVAGLELVSNSPRAIRRVIDAALGKAPRLSDEPDLAFLLARDQAAPDESFGFLSDRFVLSAVGPAQKIAAARREIALGELTIPGAASLLYGLLNGKSAASTKDLLAAGVLIPEEEAHFERSPITWQPGQAARSRFGTVTHLEPLIDLPPVDKVTPEEQRAYEQFASEYNSLWTEFADPVALRIARSPERPGRYQVTLRALPVLMRDNRTIMDMVGSAHVTAGAETSGLRYALAIGEDAAIRRELTRSSSILGRTVTFDWLGDQVVLGIANRSEVTHVARHFVSDKLEPPEGDEPHREQFEALLRLPAYLVVGVRNRVAAALALAAIRKLASEAAPEMFRWREAGKHRDIGVVEVVIAPSSGGLNLLDREASLYYALTPGAWIVSLSRPVLNDLIDAELDGKAPRGVSGKQASEHGQLLVELGADKGSALSTAFGWLATVALLEGADGGRAGAEAILRGSPESRASDDAFRAAARATLGHVPLTPDGALYRLTEQGIMDPARGTDYAPKFPETPVPGSPLATVLSRFERLHTTVSFDRELASGVAGGRDSRSFVARMTLDLRAVH